MYLSILYIPNSGEPKIANKNLFKELQFNMKKMHINDRFLILLLIFSEFKRIN